MLGVKGGSGDAKKVTSWLPTSIRLATVFSLTIDWKKPCKYYSSPLSSQIQCNFMNCMSRFDDKDSQEYKRMFDVRFGHCWSLLAKSMTMVWTATFTRAAISVCKSCYLASIATKHENFGMAWKQTSKTKILLLAHLQSQQGSSNKGQRCWLTSWRLLHWPISPSPQLCVAAHCLDAIANHDPRTTFALIWCRRGTNAEGTDCLQLCESQRPVLHNPLACNSAVA